MNVLSGIRTRTIAALVFAGIGLFGFATVSSAYDLSDREVKEEMVRRASLFCSGFSNERALPGINGVKVDALRVMLSHNYSMCPDRRLADNVGVIWNSNYGVFLWNPTNSKSVAAVSKKADELTHSMDFPNQLSVFDLDGKPLKNQIVPAFQPRDTFTRF